MRRGVHEHLPFGDGEIDFPPVLEALAATGYQGLTVVELPRHSHAGPQLAEQSLPFLHRAAAGDHPRPPKGRTPASPTDPRPHATATSPGTATDAPHPPSPPCTPA